MNRVTLPEAPREITMDRRAAAGRQLTWVFLMRSQRRVQPVQARELLQFTFVALVRQTGRPHLVSVHDGGHWMAAAGCPPPSATPPPPTQTPDKSRLSRLIQNVDNDVQRRRATDDETANGY